MLNWLVAFGLTQACEVPVYWRAKRDLRVGFLASALTHPVVWFVFPLLPLPYWPMVALAELFAVVVEGMWLRFNGVARAFLWSLLANAFSFTVGLVLRHTTGLV